MSGLRQKISDTMAKLLSFEIQEEGKKENTQLE